ncbi:hypothetical protein KGD82_21960 [Nocardiopsis eucommiae]|uniref:Uncharacterized protein n=1 Tax=Nocardiopsis eucommiae TaxID=2831970 RepID=A0A975L8C7_9ACTN|nr:hypothetical protein KGD82_21960 [Nocardiopsis eucommiae]
MQGTQRFDPGELGRRDDVHGTQRFEPGQLARGDDPAGTMMMGQQGRSPPRGPPTGRLGRGPADPVLQLPAGPERLPGHPDAGRPAGPGQQHAGVPGGEFEERGGLLGRFRRGRGDRFGDYFRGDGQGDEYDEHEDDEYYDESWRMHPLVLIPVMVALAGVALWFPWIGIILGIVVIAGLGALDVVKSEHARRLQTRGPRSSDSMVVALSFPWAFGRMALRTVGFGLIYLLGGILVGMVYARIMDVPGRAPTTRAPSRSSS